MRITQVLLLSVLWACPWFGLLAHEGEPRVDFSTLDPYQETIAREAAIAKIDTVLKKNATIENYYRITDEALVMYASPQDKEADTSEYVLRFGNQPAPERERFAPDPESDLPLQGLRVAIDPGHFGGELARTEARYVDMKPTEAIGGRTDIQFNEGTLTLLTAKKLQELLEAQGAEVFLAKENIGEGAGKSFEQWREEDFERAIEKDVQRFTEEKREGVLTWWRNEATPTQIFRQLYNVDDMKARAELINGFGPHLTIMLHYNAGAGNDSTTGQNLGTADNYSMTFVPGSFMKGELEKKRARYEFLRLLVTPDIDESVQLCQAAIRNFEAFLEIPTVNDTHAFAQGYLQPNCIPMAPGVYARNLAMTQRVHGPICYGETLCQDNFEECQRLVQEDVSVDGVPTTSRVIQVAQAYFQSILDYYAVVLPPKKD